MPRAATTKKAPARRPAATLTHTAPSTPDLFSADDWFVGIEDAVDFLNVLYYGREGGAKTTNAARMANIDHPGKVLIINAEGGLKKVPLKKRGVDLTRIVVFPDPKKHERVTHKTLNRIHQRIKIDLENDPQSWAGVVFDSATEIHQALLDTVQAKRVNALKMSGKDFDEDFVDISDYGTMSKLFRDLLRKFRDLPCHFVVTALERRDVDKDTGKPQYGPAVTPGLKTDLLGYVDMVLMCKGEDEDGPFRALTRPNTRYRAKDRLDVLPRVMVEPFFDRLVAYAEGKLDEESDPLQMSLPLKAEKAQDRPDDSEDADVEDDASPE